MLLILDGFTTRDINTKVKEHLKCIKNNNMNSTNFSVFAEHILTTGRSFNPDLDFEVLHTVDKFHKPFTYEQFELALHNKKRDCLCVNDFNPACLPITSTFTKSIFRTHSI